MAVMFSGLAGLLQDLQFYKQSALHVLLILQQVLNNVYSWKVMTKIKVAEWKTNQK